MSYTPKNADLFPEAPSPRLLPILPTMYSHFNPGDTKTRSIDLARKIILELSESEARTKDGDVCVGKEEILKITNKRRLYDVTGPLEAMGLIETTKINIIWTGCRMGAFNFVQATCRNANAVGRNNEELQKFGRRSDLQLPKTQNMPNMALPRLPKKKKVDADVRDKIKFLIKRRALLINELREKEAQAAKIRPLGVSYNDCVLGVQILINQMEQEKQSQNYTKAFPELSSTIPNLFIVSGESSLTILESQPIQIKSNIDQPKLQEKVFFEFTAKQPLEIHYICNNNQATISPNMGGNPLRNSDNQFTSPPFHKQGFFETPLLNELKFGDWDAGNE
ncbi:Conserved_hypothetical protein [Hexamita inflata]|uniref:E2F/DP family winged-helix DNA-binding domain-containing protein n=1 Tax=Hexamita inflata TaxID=28002 RepID=A0AA86P4S0_9EUKA|nr:Conserved hypothetical protein [Hexamita inflata]CAI9931628.1 Conserved hypothetical protein [Hexamita inflata]